jgi:hypothetical protein
VAKVKKSDKSEAAARQVAVERRRAERRKEQSHVAVERRQKVQRRRQIDPTTCERDYSDEEIEFMQALDAYKRKSGRMFPTCSEILEVIRDMGYVKIASGAIASPPPTLQDEEATTSV